MPAGTRGPLRESVAQRDRTAAYRWCQSLGLPCAMVGRLMPCSPGSRTFLLASLASRIDGAVRPVGLAHTSATSLTVATTARTTRFCRTRSAPLVRTKPRAHRDYPPCPRLSRTTLLRPPQARPCDHTTHDRPSRASRDGRHIRRFRISVKWNIFKRRLDTYQGVLPVGRRGLMQAQTVNLGLAYKFQRRLAPRRSSQ